MPKPVKGLWNRIKALSAKAGGRSMAKLYRRGRAEDRASYQRRRGGQYYTGSGYSKYKREFGAGFLDGVRQAIARGERPRVLEISAGQAKFLRVLQRAFPGKVETTATGLLRPPKKMEGISYRAGALDKLLPKFRKSGRQFDFILSHAGETQNLHPTAVAEVLSGLLSPKGVAYMETAVPRGIPEEWLEKEFAAAGLTIEFLGRWQERAPGAMGFPLPGGGKGNA